MFLTLQSSAMSEAKSYYSKINQEWCLKLRHPQRIGAAALFSALAQSAQAQRWSGKQSSLFPCPITAL
jgi:hypothetical protein